MEEIARLDHVYQYNELMGIETLHPLVSVIDMSKCPRMRHSRRLYGFYLSLIHISEPTRPY